MNYINEVNFQGDVIAWENADIVEKHSIVLENLKRNYFSYFHFSQTW